MTEYEAFLANKTEVFHGVGFEPEDMNTSLKPFQRDIVRWACKKGRAAIFADCGMGKSLMQLAWADQIHKKTGGNVLILAPLAVAQQTQREGDKFGIKATYSRDGKVKGPITTANYEMLQHFCAKDFVGVVIDESSILKAVDGKTRNQIIQTFRGVDYRLACTATPAPNDFVELGNHSDFLGVMSQTEMLAKFFYHDGGETQNWTLKGHAEEEFWKFVCSWAVMIRKPSDIGHDDTGYELPPLNYNQITVETESADMFAAFTSEANTLTEQRAARRESLDARVQACADLVNGDKETWIVWCDLNSEGDLLESKIDGAIQISGADSLDLKESKLKQFMDGTARVLVTKPKVAGFGLNLQHCHKQAFVGVTHSFESYYQAVRRCWRFGQEHPVDVNVFCSDREGAVVANLKRKEQDSGTMITEMLKHVSVHQDLGKTHRMHDEYKRDKAEGNGWTVHLGDCVEVAKEIPDESIGFSLFSPPFDSLYTYSNSPRDMGNCREGGEFAEHFKFLIPELYRITKPGRLASFHCMNLPTSKARDGYIGIRDFRGELIRMFQDAGWIYHSEVTIWKDPVTAMQRTKALGLLHKTIVKDSSMSRQGIPDYLVTMRKPGTNPEPIAGALDSFSGERPPMLGDDPTRNSIEIWQRYASPVWMDIRAGRTLQKESAREEKDERHICPLQLDVIDRALQLWSNPGDLVFSPFTGIGSEGYEAIKAGRKFVGAELKESYWKQACLNLKNAESLTEDEFFGILSGDAE